MRLSRIYLWTIAGTVAVAGAVIANEFVPLVYTGGASEELFATFFLVMGYAVLGLVCASVYERGTAPRLMASGMSIGLLALACWLAALFVPLLQFEYAPMRVIVWPTVWACVMMLIGILLLLPMYDGWRWWMRTSTMYLLALLGIFIATAVTLYPADPPINTQWDDEYWQRIRRYEQGAYQIGGAIALLAAGALATTLIAGIMHAISGRAVQVATARMPYWLRCPRCGCEQQAHTGDYHCTQCRLRTKVEFT